MNAAEIKARLVARTEDVCKLLLPAGKAKGGEWVCGDVENNEGKSLKVRLNGSKAGLWADFAADKQGDIIGLWMECRHQDFVAALRDIKAWLGIEDRFEAKFAKPNAIPKKFDKPALDRVKPIESGGPVFDYLTKERFIPAEILRAFEAQVPRGQARRRREEKLVGFAERENTFDRLEDRHEERPRDLHHRGRDRRLHRRIVGNKGAFNSVWS
jgi:hypothetical protein